MPRHRRSRRHHKHHRWYNSRKPTTSCEKNNATFINKDTFVTNIDEVRSDKLENSLNINLVNITQVISPCSRTPSPPLDNSSSSITKRENAQEISWLKLSNSHDKLKELNCTEIIHKVIDERENNNDITKKNLETEKKDVHLQTELNVSVPLENLLTKRRNIHCSEQKENVSDVSFYTPDLIVSTPKTIYSNHSFSSTPRSNTVRKRNSFSTVRRNNFYPKKRDPISSTLYKFGSSPISASNGGPSRIRFNLERSSVSISSPNEKTPSLKLFSRVRRFHGKYTSKFSTKLYELCAWLGINIKKSLHTLEESIIEDQCKNSESSNSHQNRIETLESELKETRQQVTSLTNQVDLLKKELQDLRKDVLDIRVEGRCFAETTLGFSGDRKPPPVCAPPAPPPPPPPPPPPMISFVATVTPLTRTLRSKCAAGSRGNDQNGENVRPSITVDDLLKVRLRKTVNRTPLVRRSQTQPEISVEMLKRVKLRRASTPQPPVDLNDVTTPKTLTEILSAVDMNVMPRVKRLQRPVNRYSFDDLSRQRNSKTAVNNSNGGIVVPSSRERDYGAENSCPAIIH